MVEGDLFLAAPGWRPEWLSSVWRRVRCAPRCRRCAADAGRDQRAVLLNLDCFATLAVTG
jgi:hypothetical protein